MYNILTALLFRTGIKCENHAASIILLKDLFNKFDLFKIISFAKEERIDKQYYITSQSSLISTKDSAKDLLYKAEDFAIQVKLLKNNLNTEQIEEIREKLRKIII